MTDPVVDQLKKLVLLTQDDETKRPPRVRDLPPCNLRPSRFWNVISSYFDSNIVTSTTANQQGAVFFQLNKLADYANYSCFDQFRVVQMEVQFIAKNTFGTNVSIPLLYTVIDYDDNTVASLTSAGMMAYDTVQIGPGSVSQTRNLKPRASMAAFTGGAFSGYALSENQWFDVASNTVDFYGVKWAIESTAISVSAYEIIVSVFLQFRSQR